MEEQGGKSIGEAHPSGGGTMEMGAHGGKNPEPAPNERVGRVTRIQGNKARVFR